MLREIRIQNLGVIDDAVLELSPGLNVVTGETGAGKTMVVSGLGLLLGARGDAGLVRSGAGTAVIEGIVEVGPGHPAAVRAADAGAEVDDELILARTVSDQGRSRAHLGGRSAPVGALAEVGRLLVAVHGQADQWRLRQPDEHRVVLDRFAGAPVEAPLGRYQTRYDELAALRAEAIRLRRLARDRAREVDLLRAGLEEIEAVDPRSGEDVDLRAEEQRLSHADGLRVGAQEAHALLVGGDDPTDGGPGGASAAVVDLVDRARAALAPVLDHDAALGGLDERLRELSYLASDVGSDLAAYQTDVEVDPQRLAWVQERRAAIAVLQRKYGDTADDVLAWAKASAATLDELETADERLETIEARVQDVTAALAAEAETLSAARAEASGHLSDRVTKELGHLAMGRAAVRVRVGQHEQADGLSLADGRRVRCSRTGVDDVEILLAANPGSPARSVAKAASGGELSRVMLALEVVTAGGDVPTFVFDEVDAGVGGAAALDVGARLAALSRSAQVIVVTHLAQVAAHADRHLVVRKTDDGHVTASGVSAVDGEDRARELARMMGGVTDSSVALEHARELLRQAQAGRRTWHDVGR